MQRVLDIDLDFFVSPVVYWPDPSVRPSDDEHAIWNIDQAIEFINNRCQIKGYLPGFVTENHPEPYRSTLWETGALANDT